MSGSRSTHDVTVLSVSVRADVIVTADVAAAAAGISTERLAHLAHLGLIEPVAPQGGGYTAASVVRLRRMLRLRRELGVNLAGASVVVDLLERLDRLEAEIERMRGGR